MKTTIGIMFLFTVLPTAVLAGENGLTAELFNRANPAAHVPVEALTGAPHETLGAAEARAREAVPHVDSPAAMLANKVSNIEIGYASEPSSLSLSLSSGSGAFRQQSDQSHFCPQPERFVE